MCTVWAATTKDKDYIQMVGMKHVVNNMEHRKEFITGNLAEFMTKGVYRGRCGVTSPLTLAGQSSRRCRSASAPTMRSTLLSFGVAPGSASV